MLIDYLPLFILFILALLLGLLVLVIGRVFGPHRTTPKKAAPYESGMIPYGPGTRRMSVRYYLVAVLFILFDVELIFFLPWAVAFKKIGLYAFIEMILFVVVLLVGFIYIWKKGALEWE